MRIQNYKGPLTANDVLRQLSQDHNLYTITNLKIITRVSTGLVVTFMLIPKSGVNLDVYWRVAYFDVKGHKRWDMIAE